MADGTDFTPDPEDALRIASHFGSGGPVEAVYSWLRSVGAGDFAAAWRGIDDNYRLCAAQAWLWRNRDHPYISGKDLEEEAQRLVSAWSDSALWTHMAEVELRHLQEMCGQLPELLEAGSLGAGSATRVLGPDLELIILIQTDEVLVFNGPTLVDSAFPFVVRMTQDGWKVAAFGDFVPEPGWPPRAQRPAG